VTRLFDTLRLLRDVWSVRRGRAQRIARPGKWRVMVGPNGRGVIVELLP
jgi:hypothetical protein